jgi:hypothetical protein
MGGHVAREERRETYTNFYYTLYTNFWSGNLKTRNAWKT